MVTSQTSECKSHKIETIYKNKSSLLRKTQENSITSDHKSKTHGNEQQTPGTGVGTAVGAGVGPAVRARGDKLPASASAIVNPWSARDGTPPAHASSAVKPASLRLVTLASTASLALNPAARRSVTFPANASATVKPAYSRSTIPHLSASSTRYPARARNPRGNVGAGEGAMVGAPVGDGVGAGVGTFETLPPWHLDELVGSLIQTMSSNEHEIVLTKQACDENCQICSEVHRGSQGLSNFAELFKYFYSNRINISNVIDFLQHVTNGVHTYFTEYSQHIFAMFCSNFSSRSMSNRLSICIRNTWGISTRRAGKLYKM